MTQADLARRLGLHRSTVSKALKGDPAVAEKTRAAVREAARASGFRPDPMLSALARYRKKRPQVSKTAIGWIYNYPPDTDMSLYAGYEDYFAGARDQADELGYHLVPLWIDGKRLTCGSLPRVLKARGIRAVIFAPQAKPGTRLDFPMDDFCGVSIGYSLLAPRMDVVTNDHFTTMTGILERLRGSGHDRIGCHLWQEDNERMGRRAGSAFLAFSQDFSAQINTYRSFSCRRFLEWIREHRFDAVVGRGIEQAKAVKNGMPGTRKPTFAGYSIDPGETRFPGMCHNNRLIGARAAEWTCGKLERGQFGASPVPQRLLVAGTWLESAPTAS